MVNEGEQSHHPRPLDRNRQAALLFRRQARDPPRQNLTALGDELLERIGIFVVDIFSIFKGRLALAQTVGHERYLRNMRDDD